VIIDGITIGEVLLKGGMVILSAALKDGLPTPAILKAPRLSHGEDLAAIVGFEMEMMILPRLSGQHGPKVYRVGEFSGRPTFLVVLRGRVYLPKLMLWRCRSKRWCGSARRRRMRWRRCIASMWFISILSHRRSCSAKAEKRF
jgi:hypothetical protein